MITLSKFKEKIQGKFEGGNSMNLNWYNIAKEAGQAMLDNISPKRLTRMEDIFGGVVGGVKVYYSPADLGTPNGLFKQLAKLDYEYVPSGVFYDLVRDFPYRKLFTKAFINGAVFVLISNQEETEASLQLDDMSDTSSVTIADMSVVLNTYDYLTGTGSFMATFGHTLNKINATILDGAIDITDSLFGTAVLSAKITDKENIESITVKLKTDDSNYYTLTASTALDYLINGWNFIKLSIADRATTGSPVLTNINSYEVKIATKLGTSQVILIDNLTIYNTAPYTLAYVSNKLFLDKTTLLRKSDASDLGDIIEVEDDEEQIIILEACRIVVQEGTNDNVNAGESVRFDRELSRKYSSYFAKNPSDRKPLSYNYSDNDERLQ